LWLPFHVYKRKGQPQGISPTFSYAKEIPCVYLEPFLACF
jgi:hypothetical protein